MLLFCIVGAIYESPLHADDYKPIIGSWLRPDGGYKLVFKDVDEEGNIDARYYNPNDINVSIAKARVENGKINIYVELRDTGYPGSNYNLIYDPGKDRLLGVYYHAVLKKNFDVYFVRKATTYENL